jgi:mannose/fructose/N-acetylgalactosamine-specific phosphotransferase system component IID
VRAVDVRRKRPPALAFLLRMETLRQVLRVASLLVIDFAGVFAAIYVALMVKAVLRGGEWAWTASLDETRNTIAFAYLVTVLLFARSGLYASRAERPGLSRIVSSLAQVMVVALIFALVNGETYSSYYIFYGTLAFAICLIGSLCWL